MKICKICGYYSRVVCEKTRERFIEMIDYYKSTCEFFKDMTIP